MSIRVYNTRTRSLEPLRPKIPGHVGMYVCGMTVYDYCHIGHARAMLTFDVVYRHLLHRGFDVNYVRNYTDVDDKIIKRAAELGEDPIALSARFCDALDEDLAALGLREPSVEPKVSTHIDQILAMTQRLIDRGHAYADEAGNVWFAVESFDRYGALSGRKLEDLREGVRVDVHTGKRHPADFALWKAKVLEDEPAWPSPWGEGRPGWHIECSAMSTTYLGDGFDIHGGGLDLVFPHHENEVAQSECATGTHPYAEVWMHNGMLTLGETKMSKSLGNIITIRELMEQIPAEVLRLLYLQGHYRSPLPFDQEALDRAVVATDRLYRSKEIALALSQADTPHKPKELVREWGAAAAELWDLASKFRSRFDEAMDADFNTAKALAGLFELARAINRLSTDKRARKRGAPLFREALKAFDLAGEVLGIGGSAPQAFFDELKVKRLEAAGADVASIEARIVARAEARASKDWAAADALRAELTALGVEVMDTADGYVWRVKVDAE